MYRRFPAKEFIFTSLEMFGVSSHHSIAKRRKTNSGYETTSIKVYNKGNHFPTMTCTNPLNTNGYILAFLESCRSPLWLCTCSLDSCNMIPRWDTLYILLPKCSHHSTICLLPSIFRSCPNTLGPGVRQHSKEFDPGSHLIPRGVFRYSLPDSHHQSYDTCTHLIYVHHLVRRCDIL